MYMNTPKRTQFGFLAILLLSAALILPGVFGTGCGSTRLEQGGAYAPTNQVGDLQFYQADALYDVTYFTLDAVFKFEADNRAGLWKISPDIKHTLDKIRPTAWQVNVEYLKAREAYKANPVPANLAPMQTAIGKLQQLLATANAVIPKAN